MKFSDMDTSREREIMGYNNEIVIVAKADVIMDKKDRSAN